MKLRATGRGNHFSPGRGVVEALQGLIYARDWPARAWNHVPAATRVRQVRHALDLGRGRAPLKLAFVSDLHVGPLTPPQLLDAAF